MSAIRRPLRRAALLLFPGESLREDVLDTILREGFTDVGIGVKTTPTVPGQGFSIPQARELAAMCQARHLGIIAFTGYMKYQEALLNREPQRTMILSGRGRILDLDGLPVRWLCPFRPENKSLYLDLLREICQWPAARDIHLNDEASLGFRGGVIGCYCDYCRARFRAATGAEPPVAADWSSPLWRRWIEHRLSTWTAIHAELRDEIRRLRPDIAVGIQHSPYVPEHVYSAWESGIALARDARAMDFISTDPYHFIHCDGIRHRPHRRILAECTRALVGACLDRGATLYPQGFMPPGQSTPLGRQDGLLAGIVPYALGADTVMPFTYELMNIIPGYSEGFDDSRRLLSLLREHRPYSFATLLCPQQSELQGRPDEGWAAGPLRETAEALRRTGLPWRWFWDERLTDAASLLRGPLVLPETHCLTPQQTSALRAVVQRGDGALWIGNAPQTPWDGYSPCPLPAATQKGAFELKPVAEHPLFVGLDKPVVLSSRVEWNGPPGRVIAEIEGRPAMVLIEEGDTREIWLAGAPTLFYQDRNAASGIVALPTSNGEFLRRLLLWLARQAPLARLSPYPPEDDYRRLRPADYRSVPTLDLLPLWRNTPEGTTSLLAIVFPFTPVAARTALRVAPPPGKRLRAATERWREEDWTARARLLEDGEILIPIEMSGDAELLALHIEFA